MDGEMGRDFASPQLLGTHECSSGGPGTLQGALSQVPDFLHKVSGANSTWQIEGENMVFPTFFSFSLNLTIRSS